MKERPILFSAPMVRAIIDGRKSQTRRIIKEPEWYGCPTGDCHHGTQQECDEAMNSEDVLTDCPYGVSGDRIWVRERFQYTTDERGTGVIVYAADDAAHFLLAKDNGDGDLCGVGGRADRGRCHPIERWRPSIHMPRWASRITREVVEVRVERLQEISEEDAVAEGFEVGHPAGPRHWYQGLWDSINGPGSWAANPWVWAICFRVIDGSGATA